MIVNSGLRRPSECRPEDFHSTRNVILLNLIDTGGSAKYKLIYSSFVRPGVQAVGSRWSLVHKTVRKLCTYYLHKNKIPFNTTLENSLFYGG